MKLKMCALYCHNFEPTVFSLFCIFYLLIYSIRNQQLPFKICHVSHYLQVCVIKGSQTHFQTKSCSYERVQGDWGHRLLCFSNKHRLRMFH